MPVTRAAPTSQRTDRPRIALVCGNLEPARDGVADYTLHLREALGHRADVWLATVGPAAGAAEPTAGPRLIQVAGGWNARGVAALAGALRRVAPDVVHVQFAPSAFGYSPAVGLLPLLLPTGTRLVTTLHEYDWWSWPAHVPDRLWRLVERRRWWDRETLALAPRSSRVIVTNGAHANAVRGRLGVSPRSVPVGANVVPDPSADRPAVRRAARSRLGLPTEAPVLAFFGFVHPVKGLRYLVEALAMLVPEHPGVRLVIVGGFASLALSDPEADAFRRELAGRAREAGVADRVLMTGHLPAAEASAVLTAVDIAVLPFTGGVTAKSGALAAVAAHGLPVVVTAADPPDPTLVDARTAVVVPRVRDAEALAAGIRRLLVDADLGAQVQAGLVTLLADRGWARIADAHLELYGECQGGGVERGRSAWARAKPPAGAASGGGHDLPDHHG
ncbi:glycosyltransferase [Parafrankia elaeagni]|uniref:glycosyltransferase n=1 Tax=Parafrankia elaeagni TaxID=222534 RepID=UPI0003612B49|nr:glycosyltransferase [Parafrankia elaeagni]